MIVGLHPEIQIRKLTIGAEQAPLLVIDNFVAEPERLVRRASSRMFTPLGRFYPGIRAEAPPSYQTLFTQHLRDLLFSYFGLQGTSLRFPMCHYSIVTTRPEDLAALQRIPHNDSYDHNGVASIHYLFHGDQGGTAFYRHRQTGFEYVDESRRAAYSASRESENAGPDVPPAQYINGDTPLFEQIGKQEGIFNRILIYRRTSLHSGCIGADFVPDPNPQTGRLSVNTFVEVER